MSVIGRAQGLKRAARGHCPTVTRVRMAHLVGDDSVPTRCLAATHPGMLAS